MAIQLCENFKGVWPGFHAGIREGISAQWCNAWTWRALALKKLKWHNAWTWRRLALKKLKWHRYVAVVDETLVRYILKMVVDRSEEPAAQDETSAPQSQTGRDATDQLIDDATDQLIDAEPAAPATKRAEEAVRLVRNEMVQAFKKMVAKRGILTAERAVCVGCCDSGHNKMTLTVLLEFPVLKTITAVDDNFCGGFVESLLKHH